MKEIDEGNILAAYLLVALLTFGYSWNADHVAPVKGIVNGREVVIQSGAVDTILTATFAGAFWPIYWSVTAFKSFRPAQP